MPKCDVYDPRTGRCWKISTIAVTIFQGKDCHPPLRRKVTFRVLPPRTRTAVARFLEVKLVAKRASRRARKKK